MKKVICFLVIGLAFLFGFHAFADDVAAQAPAGFEFLNALLPMLIAIPKIGPVLIWIFKVVGILASVMTAVSIFVASMLKIPEIAARLGGAKELADKFAKVYDKVMPWLMYLSIFNVKK